MGKAKHKIWILGLELGLKAVKYKILVPFGPKNYGIDLKLTLSILWGISNRAVYQAYGPPFRLFFKISDNLGQKVVDFSIFTHSRLPSLPSPLIQCWKLGQCLSWVSQHWKGVRGGGKNLSCEIGKSLRTFCPGLSEDFKNNVYGYPTIYVFLID